MQQRYVALGAWATLAILGWVVAPAVAGWWAAPWHAFFGRREFWWDAEDFAVFYAAGKLVAAGDAHLLYTPSAFTPIQSALLPTHQDVTLGYYNPPFFALLFAPISWLSFDRAYQVWFSLNLLVLAFNAWLLWRIAAPLGLAWQAALTIALLTLYPVTFAFRLGQYSLILMASWSSAYLLLRSGRERAAGLALAPLLIKPELLIPVTLLLAWKGRRAVLSTLLPAAAVAATVSIVMIGLRETVAYPGYLREAAFAGTGNMYGWNGLLSSLLAPGNPGGHTSLALPLSLLTLAAVAVVWRGDADPGGERFPSLWLLLTIATVLVDLHFYLQDIIIIVPAAVGVAAAQRQGARWVAGGALAFGWLLLGFGSTPTATWGINIFTSYMLVCLVALCSWEYVSRFVSRPPRGTALRGGFQPSRATGA
ncbi:MAG: glycosyltransferase family 87 protein [Dehalococcoidia bacterium]